MVARSPPAGVHTRDTRLPCRHLQRLERQRGLGDVRERRTASATDPPTRRLRGLRAGVVAGRPHDRVLPSAAHGRRDGRRRLPHRRRRPWRAEADVDPRGGEAPRLVARRPNHRRRARPDRQPHRRVDADQRRNGAVRRRGGMVARTAGSWPSRTIGASTSWPRRAAVSRASSRRRASCEASPGLRTAAGSSSPAGGRRSASTPRSGSSRRRISTWSGRTAAGCGASLRRPAQSSRRAGARRTPRPCASGRR